MSANKIEPVKLLADLNHFTGTTQWYRNPLFPKFLYTDGVQFLAENAGCYWLIDYIFSHQINAKIKGVPFQVWTISTDGGQAVIKVEDGNKKVLKSFEPIYSDFPFKEYTLWFTDNVLLLVSEY